MAQRPRRASRVPFARTLIAALAVACSLFSSTRGAADVVPPIATYTNALTIRLPGGGLQTNCADPTVLHSETPGDPYWYVYCTTDSLGDADVDASGARRTHLIPGLRSMDLVTWDSIGDAFTSRPAWVSPGAGMWAPEIVRLNGRYQMYFVATDVTDAVSGEPGCTSDNAIGVATSDSLAGPWVDSGAPVVLPRRAGGGCNFFWTYDPDVLVTTDGAYLYYGSYYGGIEVRPLSADGLSTSADAAVPVAIGNRYEGANVVSRGGYYYLFASASNCCNGPLTGYQVFTARSTSPLGPFVDALGLSMRDAQVGGTPFLTMNGNRWVGPGHNSTFQDARGDWFTLYHAIDRDDPYFAGAVGYTKRPLLLDRVTWKNGWPSVRGGLGPSDTPKTAPHAQPATTVRRADDALDPTAYLRALDALDVGSLPVVAEASDDLRGAALSPQWSWVRPPTGGVLLGGSGLALATQAADLNGTMNDASVLTEAAPAGDYVVETKVTVDVPPAGCCFNFVQAGLVVYAGDDDYVKLVSASIWETRQTEFAKEVSAPAPGFPVYGTSVGGPPGPTTWLRIARLTRDGTEAYVSYSSRDGASWVRGAVWTHGLGAGARIGLVAMGGSGFTATFDYVRVRGLPAL